MATTLIDDGTQLSVLFGRPEPNAANALRAGRALVADPALVRNGTVSFDLTIMATTTETPAGASVVAAVPGAPRRIVVPAISIAPTSVADPLLILPPALAARLGMVVNTRGVLDRLTRLPTDHQVQAAAGALAAVSPDLRLVIETGYRDSDTWLSLSALIAAIVLAVAASMIATALSNLDGHPDLVTLGAVGATPNTRRRLSMSRAGIVAGIGTSIGVIGGLVAPAAWVLAVNRQAGAHYPRIIGDGRVLPPTLLHLVIPWPTIVALGIGIPIIAGLVAAATSPARLPAERPST